MKRQTGIWIDTSKAIIVTLEGGKDEKISEIDSDVENRVYHDKEGNKGTFSGVHHGSSETKFDNRKKQEIDFFVKSVLDYVKGADELFVFGPAETKIRLEQKIQDEKLFAHKLKAVETADKMTLNEIVAKVKKFYVTPK
ncbi:hypothetical protein H4V97_002098 [Flavobacterium sp. CG_23.5]|jgi:hypothetical protein|uniref:hypothetical protein n=1 Tax=unclassified Flavobacterium TaxID=196869 RepID=UPI0018C9D8CB|nr:MULTISPECIES: hypothetical protein [unclassified Flavobacterium]MBG6110878.1 hypothetical protein [Flavobacterium sp. CG_9.10]MBP2283780.1 hypothetical protein [Flavobacterium sp. CG_23.5]